MKILLTSFLLFFLVQAYAADTMIVNVNANQKQFHVNLPANPTTGYQWDVVSFDSLLVQLLYSQYLRPKSNLVGAGGEMQYNFELLPGKIYPAKTIMQFKYHRPWESEGGTVKKVTIYFQKNKH